MAVKNSNCSRKSCNCTLKSTAQKLTTTFPLDDEENVLPPLLVSISIDGVTGQNDDFHSCSFAQL